MGERQVSLPASLSLVTWCFMKTVANLIKKRWETSNGKAALCLLSQVSPRGLAAIKSWGFAFHRVWALRVWTPYPRPHFFPRHTTGLLWVQIRGQLQLSADEGQLKNLVWASYLQEVPEFFSVHWEMLAFTSESQYRHQHNTTDFLIKLYL